MYGLYTPVPLNRHHIAMCDCVNYIHVQYEYVHPLTSRSFIKNFQYTFWCVSSIPFLQNLSTMFLPSSLRIPFVQQDFIAWSFAECYAGRFLERHNIFIMHQHLIHMSFQLRPITTQFLGNWGQSCFLWDNFISHFVHFFDLFAASQQNATLHLIKNNDNDSAVLKWTQKWCECEYGRVNI